MSSTDDTSSAPPSTPRPTNLTFVDIPFSDVPRETDELSFLLRPSKIAGVGVIITHPVKKGTFLALFVEDDVRRVPRSEMAKNPQLHAFCVTYGIERREYVCVPKNFSYMEVGWFLNHSKTPNAEHDGKWIALRDIEAGEEITIDYGENF